MYWKWQQFSGTSIPKNRGPMETHHVSCVPHGASYEAPSFNLGEGGEGAPGSEL